MKIANIKEENIEQIGNSTKITYENLTVVLDGEIKILQKRASVILLDDTLLIKIL